MNGIKGGKNKLSAGLLAELSVFCALMVAGKEAFSAIPNVHPVTLLVIVCAACYGKLAAYPVFGFVALETCIYGLGLWTVMYLYVWPLLLIVCLTAGKNAGRLARALIAGFHGLLFGALCSLPYVFLSGLGAAFAYWIAGIPYDIVHCISNFLVTFFFSQPLIDLVIRIRKR